MAIRTLTEFSGTLIRMAAKAEAEAKKALPTESAPAAAAAPVSAEAEQAAAPTQAEPEAAAAESTGEAAQAAAPEAAEAAAPEAAEAKPAAAAPVEAAESEAVKAALDEAVSKATGTTGDRLARLREALHAAGRQTDRVRLVRVFGGEDVVAGAKKIGEHQFLVDLMPASMKQVFKDPKDEKGKSRGPKRPSGSTKNKNDASLEGSFSMETVAQDRKSERGAPGSKRPGGPGGAPGARPGGNRGGRPGGNGPPRGGRTSGAPKP